MTESCTTTSPGSAPISGASCRRPAAACRASGPSPLIRLAAPLVAHQRRRPARACGGAASPASCRRGRRARDRGCGTRRATVRADRRRRARARVVRAGTRSRARSCARSDQLDEAGVADEAVVGELGDLDHRPQLGADPRGPLAVRRSEAAGRTGTRDRPAASCAASATPASVWLNPVPTPPANTQHVAVEAADEQRTERAGAVAAAGGEAADHDLDAAPVLDLAPVRRALAGHVGRARAASPSRLRAPARRWRRAAPPRRRSGAPTRTSCRPARRAGRAAGGGPRTAELDRVVAVDLEHVEHHQRRLPRVALHQLEARPALLVEHDQLAVEDRRRRRARRRAGRAARDTWRSRRSRFDDCRRTLPSSTNASVR